MKRAVRPEWFEVALALPESDTDVPAGEPGVCRLEEASAHQYGSSATGPKACRADGARRLGAARLFGRTLVLAAVLAVDVASGGVATAATFIVNSTSDASDVSTADGLCVTLSGACTLRAAIQQANYTVGRDRIEVPAGTYTLSSHGYMRRHE